MGLINKVKDKITGGGESEEEEDFADFEDEFAEEDGFEDFEDEEEFEEESVQEWDTAYQFADDMVQQVGFTGIKEFTDKAMVKRIEMSPLYRDRIKSGVETMDMVSDSMRGIRELREESGSGSPDRSYQEYAEEVRSANDLIDELDRMEGKEEQIANEVIGIARDAVDAMKEGKSSSVGDVNSSMGVSKEE